MLEFYLSLSVYPLLDAIFSWLIGVEFSGRLDEITRERIGVEVLEIYIRGVESILFLRDKGPCIWY
jgi:hypothetical protein